MALLFVRRAAIAVSTGAIAALATVTTGCGESAGTSSPDSTADPATVADEVMPEGFDLVTLSITPKGEDPVEFTMWFAGAPEQWYRGLTDVTDLGEAAGMLFAFDPVGDYQFHMWQTPMPLDIVFFDAAGTFVGRADMPPCLDSTAGQCPRYSPGTPFAVAIEIPDGAFDNLGVDEGTTLSFAMLERAPTSSAP